MGCTASKLENEDTVRRCKERRSLMKEAVYARHHLAAAHSDYCRSLRVTGAALSTFAAGEPLSVSDQTPAVLLRTPSSSTTRSTTTTTRLHHPPPQPPPPVYIPSPSPSVHPPPPPPPISPSISSSKVPHILSSPTNLRRKKQPQPQPQPPMKLPHILSDSSSFSSSPKKPEKDFAFTYHARANSTFSTTPSQDGSSVWNWEQFYPPSPPDSEYFQQLQTKKSNQHNANSFHYVDDFGADDDDKSSSYTSYTRHSQKGDKIIGDQRSRADNNWESGEGEREEVQCGEWGDHDHYSTTSSSDVDGDVEDALDDDDDVYDDLRSRSDIGTRSNFGSVKSESVVGGKGNSYGGSIRNWNVGVKHSTTNKLDKLSDDGESSSMSWGNGKGGDKPLISDRRIVVRHKDLVEIVAALKDYFDKAAAAGDQVSEMLETGRAQLDRSFRQLKKTVYHSSGLLSNLSSSWTSKPPLAVKYQFEPMSIEQSGGPKSLLSTLERLFAWEKKLYEEVKARERVKIEHEKKLSTLQSQEGRGEEEAKLDKTKTSIKRLQSLIVVTSQAVSTTSSAIIGVRDSELVPQLVELCHGFMYMWRSMNQFHEIQNDVVQQVRGLINRSIRGESTSDLHRQATRDLESAVSAWHSSFCRLIKFQRDFIRSLHGWFKLTLIPVNIEPNHGNKDPSDAFSFCDEWKLALDRIPDTVASEAIKSFINVVHSISSTQTEEMKIKKRTESASKELERKASSLRNIEKKYYNSYSMVGLGLPDTGPDNGHILDARDPLAEKKAELSACQRKVEDEMVKHSKAVEVTRAMTLNNLQTGLPGVFQAMTSFSSLIMEALEAACTRSYAIK